MSQPNTARTVGRSAATSNGRDGATIVAELRALLSARGVRPPYLLVGHSAGGLYMQLFARLHPDEVAGLVLVDPTHPAQFTGEGALSNRGGVASAAITVAGLFGPARAEFDALGRTGQQVLAAPPLLQPMPLVILIAPEAGGTSMADFDNGRRRDHARLYPQARMIEVDGGHAVPQARPQAVIDAIREVIGHIPPR